MLKVAIAVCGELLAQKICRALASFESSFAWYASLPQLISAMRFQAFDLIVVHYPHDHLDEATSLSFDRNLLKATPAMAIISDRHLECSVPLLNAGMDRCLPESFDESHFSAVVRALTRRSHGLISSVSQYGALSFNHETKRACLHGEEIELTKREAQVLEILLKRVGQIVPKEDFIEAIAPNNIDLNACVVEVYIHRLRKKIKSEYLPIRNIKRCGYFLKRFDSPCETITYSNAQSGLGMGA